MKAKESSVLLAVFLIISATFFSFYMLLKPDTKRRTVTTTQTVTIQDDKYTIDDFNSDLENDETKTVYVSDSTYVSSSENTSYISKSDLSVSQKNALLEKLNLSNNFISTNIPDLEIDIQNGEISKVKVR